MMINMVSMIMYLFAKEVGTQADLTKYFRLKVKSCNRFVRFVFGNLILIKHLVLQKFQRNRVNNNNNNNKIHLFQ